MSKFNLFDQFFSDNDDDFSILNSHECPYVTNNCYNNALDGNRFSILSVNVRSLSSKINELSNFMLDSEKKFLTDCVAI